jgi:hypothetical protein
MMRGLTIQRTMVVVLFLLIFAMALQVPVSTDTWWQLRAGQTVLETGDIDFDTYSHTYRGEPWNYPGWAAQVMLYSAYSLAGDLGLALFTALLATAGMGFVFAAMPGQVPMRAFLLVLAGLVAATFWSARPQMFSFLLSAVWMAVLVWYLWRGINRLWVLPVTMLLWVNLHAGFAIGFLLLGAAIAGEALGVLTSGQWRSLDRWRSVIALTGYGLAAIAVLPINPDGFDVLSVPFATLSIGPLQSSINEWQSPNFHLPGTWSFVVMLIVLMVAFWVSHRPLVWTSLFWVGGTLFMALLAGRNFALFAVAASPVLARHLDDGLQRAGWVLRPNQNPSPMMVRANIALIALVALVVAVHGFSLLNAERVNEVRRQVLPVDAVAFMKDQNPPRNLFNSYNWGGYILHALPDVPVFIDGRTDLYGEFIAEYQFAVAGMPVWRALFAEYGISSALIERGTGLDFALREEPGWRVVYEDELAALHYKGAQP